jgi:peptide/nickel transport system permease protein
MTRLLVRRILAAVPLVLGVLTLVFVLVETAPGDPSAVLLGDRPVPPEVRARIVAAYGLDRPPVERYLRWLGSVALRGELGWSISRGRPVTRVLAGALPATLLLSGAALLFHLAAGVALGLATARWRGRWPDRALGAASLALYSMPAFWVGLMAILSLSLALGWFPPGATHSVGAETWPLPRRAADLAWHLALPAAILGMTSAAALGRFIRSGVLAALGEEFVRAARARGAGGGRVLFGHALRNALLPAITLAGLSLPVLVSGSLVTEVVFSWPGMGRVAYEAILARDVPVVLAATLLSSLLVVAGNLAADVALVVADPRIRAGRRGASP